MKNQRLISPICTALILYVTSGALAAEAGQTIPIDGQRFDAELLSVDAKWNLVFREGTKQRRLAADELVSWGAPVEPKRYQTLPRDFPAAELLLADGGLLLLDIRRSKNDRLIVESTPLGELEIPLDRMRGILFDPPVDRRRRDRLANRVNEAVGADRLILINDDVVTGRVTRFVAFDAADNKRKPPRVEIKVNGALIQIEARRIAAVAFNSKLVRDPNPRGRRAIVGFRDGSRLLATSLQADQNGVRVTLASGEIWKASRDALVFLQPLGGRARYLSDLVLSSSLDEGGAKGTIVGKPRRKGEKPRNTARYRHVPFLSVAWPYHADRNALGMQLRCGGRLHLKGLGMHSTSFLTIAMPEKGYRRFEADVALDDSAGKRGSVTFGVLVHGKKKDAQGKERTAVIRQFKSPVIRGGMPPVPLSVDLTGAVGITLIVLFAERGDELDHADWLEARLVR